MKVREELLQRVEGKALLRDDSGRWPLLLSLRADRQFWIEIRSPLGSPFAVLRADEEWVEFYVPRRKELYRIPAVEFWRPSLRQRDFLKLLPVAIKPEQMIDVIFGRLRSDAVDQCRWSDQARGYEIIPKPNSRLADYYLLDGLAYFPIQAGTEKSSSYLRHVSGRIYRSPNFEFAAVFDLYRNFKKESSFEWTEINARAELGSTPPLFPESLQVKRVDY